MKIFLKYILKSISEKKGRTALLILIISINVALLISTLGVTKSIVDKVKNGFGSYNVIINKSNSNNPFLKGKEIDKADFKDSVSLLETGGYLTEDITMKVKVIEMNLEDYRKFDSINLLNKDKVESSIENKAIISLNTSKSSNLKIGDEINITVYGEKYSYTIGAIAENTGLFLNDKENIFPVVIPQKNLVNIDGEENSYTSIIAKVDVDNLNKWISDFNVNYENKDIEGLKIYDEATFNNQLNALRSPLYIMIGLIVLMTGFIICSTFKTIIIERFSTIGTYLSVGATRGQIILILSIEAIIYGILGGIVGYILSIGADSIIIYALNPVKNYGVNIGRSFYGGYLLGGIIFAVLISLITSYIGCLSFRKKPLKEIILNTIDTKDTISKKGFILGCILIVVIFIIYNRNDIMLGLVRIFLGIFVLILITPKIIDVIISPILKWIKNSNGIIFIALNNTVKSKILINNIRILVVSIVMITLVSSLSISIINTVDVGYSNMRMKVYISTNMKDSKIVNDFLDTHKDDYESNYISEVKINSWLGKNGEYFKITVINPENYKTFEDYTVFEDKDKQLTELENSENGIIVSKEVAVKNNIKVGDKIKIHFEDHYDDYIELTVLSLFDAKMMLSGNFNLVTKDVATKYLGFQMPTEYFVNSNKDEISLKEELSTVFNGLDVDISTKSEMIENDKNSNQIVIDMVDKFPYINLVIAIIAIIGNLSISFIQRKREISIISSIGMSQRDRGYMIFLENIFQGIISLVLGLISTTFMNKLLGQLMKSFMVNIDIKYPFNDLPIIVIGILLIVVIVSIIPILKNREISIIDEIKYE